ncbi:hypothetical protein FVI60_09335, partial [Campylobacter jejuni]|nr:hypothetical protein [Campylobacter jejuni]
MSRSNNHRTPLVDSKRHYKMYKSKKGWIVAGITTATMAGMFLTTTFTANADSIDPTSSTTLTTPETTPNADVSDVTNKTGSTENGDGYNVSVDHTALDNAVSNAKTAGVDVTQGETTSTTVSSKDASSAVSSISSDYAQQTSEVETATKKQEAKNSAYSNDTQDAEQTNAANKEKIDNAVQALKDAGGSAIYDNSKDTTTTATIDNYSETKKQVNDSVESTVKDLEDATAQKQAENKVANVAQDRSELDSAVEKAKSVLGEENVHQTESVQTDNVTAANADEISKKISDDYKNQVNNINNAIDEYEKKYSDYKKKIDEYRAKLSSDQITSS